MISLEYLILAPIVLQFHISKGFKVTSDGSGPIATEEGGSIRLLCRSDYYYEYCTFTSPMGEVCHFEWRRREWNITMKACDNLARDVTFIGSYNDFECGIEVKNVNYEYLGNWKCQMEQYVFGGSKGSGYRASSRFNVFVPTTTTTTTSTRAPRTGRKLDLDGAKDLLDVTLDVNLLGDEITKTGLKNKALAKMFGNHLVSGGIAFIVMIVFIAIFAYIVHRHRAAISEQDIEGSDNEGASNNKKPTNSDDTKSGKQVLPRNHHVSSLPDTPGAYGNKIQWGSPKLRNKIPLSPPSMLSTCSSNRSSRRTSLTSIVPSVIEEDKMEQSHIEFVMKVLPHLITMSPEEQVRADFSRRNSDISITGPVPV